MESLCVNRRAAAVLCLLALSTGERSHAQQTTETIVISSNEYWEVRPTTCPTHMQGGFLGQMTGYWHGGYSWTAEWARFRFPNPADVSRAEYRPDIYDGYASGKGNYIRSGGGSARWYNPELYIRCTATWRYAFGFLVGVDERYKVLENRGQIEVCGGRGTAVIDDPDPYGMNGGPSGPYDPYAVSSEDECDDSGNGGNGGGSPSTCWNEYVYVEISYDGGLTWETMWEGWATVCE